MFDSLKRSDYTADDMYFSVYFKTNEYINGILGGDCISCLARKNSSEIPKLDNLGDRLVRDNILELCRG